MTDGRIEQARALLHALSERELVLVILAACRLLAEADTARPPAPRPGARGRGGA